MAQRGKQQAARYPRSARVNELLREVIADALERSDEDARLDLVTITGVETSPDLRHAIVYFSALDTKASLDEVGEALADRRVELQRAIASSSSMKRTPQLKFIPDAGILEGQHIEGILSKLPPIVDQPDLEEIDLRD